MTSLAENLINVKNIRPPLTRFQKGVKQPTLNMLKSGANNKKLGSKIKVKKWKNMPLYSLTLEERATCPSDCEQWENCYGDNMPFAHRYDDSASDFNSMLETQLTQLSNKHPSGFVIRLHVLGDFRNKRYINQWKRWLTKFPSLNAFGYTHHKLMTAEGQLINAMNNAYPDRWQIRFSDDTSTSFNATVTKDPNYKPTKTEIMCPEQTGLTASCATCGYCWSSNKSVVFVEH